MSTPAQTTTTTTTTGTSQPTSDAEEDDAFTPTFYFYPWVGGVFSRGWAASKAKRLLETDDMLKLPLDETIGPTCADVIRLWEEEMERYTAELPTYKTPEEAAANEPALFKILMKANMKHMIIGALLRIVSDGCSIAAPFFLRYEITWLAQYVSASPKPPIRIGTVRFRLVRP